ncbi:MAG: hypothetical protein ABFC94_15050 [Syntrophomonas sp.]
MDQDKSLNLKITSYVNENLKEIIRVYLDYLYEDDGFEIKEKLLQVLPRDYVLRKPDECKNLVDELYEIIISPLAREYLKPKYEYLLYMIMNWWKDIGDEDILIPIKLGSDLVQEINVFQKEYLDDIDGSNYLLEQLLDYDDYMNFCFCDHDFLPNNLEHLVSIFLHSPQIMDTIFADVDLDNYIDLMPVDLRELYLETKKFTDSSSSLDDEYTELFNRLLSACLEIQSNKLYSNATEDERNTYIASLLEFAGYQIQDQTRRGRSHEGKNAGELDIFVRKINGEPFAVVEAFNLGSLDKSYIDLHLKKIFGYDSNGLTQNFVLIYSKAANFNSLCNKYFNYLSSVNYPYKLVGFLEDKNIRFSEIRVGLSTHSRNNRNVLLNHIIVNMN